MFHFILFYTLLVVSGLSGSVSGRATEDVHRLESSAVCA